MEEWTRLMEEWTRLLNIDDGNDPMQQWVRFLRIDDKVFLTKEGHAVIALIEIPYHHDEKSGCGKIAIKRFGSNKSEVWYVRPDGTGIDGIRIIAPYGQLDLPKKAVETENKTGKDRWGTI